MKDFIIHKAKIKDAHEIASLLVSSWKHTYEKQLPTELLNQLSVPEREEQWKKRIARNFQNERIYVVKSENKIIAVTHVGIMRDVEASKRSGEIYSIYVIPEYIGMKVGTKLLQEGETFLRKSGFEQAYIWVLKTNEIAKRFYEKHGWKPDGETKTAEKNDFKLEEVRYAKQLIES